MICLYSILFGGVVLFDFTYYSTYTLLSFRYKLNMLTNGIVY